MNRQSTEAREDELLLRELTALAEAIHRRRYWHVKQWRPLDTPRGVLSQINNMVAGLLGDVEAPPSEEVVEAVARAIDPEAWLAMEDGRDIPGTFWHVRRDIARDEARAAIAAIQVVWCCGIESARATCQRSSERPVLHAGRLAYRATLPLRGATESGPHPEHKPNRSPLMNRIEQLLLVAEGCDNIIARTEEYAISTSQCEDVEHLERFHDILAHEVVNLAGMLRTAAQALAQDSGNE